MRDLQDRLGLTYLFISHNLAVVRHMANRIGVMYLGRIVEIGGGRELFTAPKHPTPACSSTRSPTLRMSDGSACRCRARSRTRSTRRQGAPFTRCPFANERCKAEVPVFRDGVACHAVEEGG